MIISATLRVFEKGALKTGTPRRFAPARSTWFVPMQKQPTERSLRPAASALSRHARLAADAEHVDVGDRAR